MNRIIRSCTSVALLTVALAATAFAGSASAAPQITSPADGATIRAGANLTVTWVAACPAGMVCGDYSNGRVYENQELKLEHGRWPGFGKSYGNEWRSGPWAPGTHTWKLNEDLTAGPWKLTATWDECAAPVAPATTVDGATCTEQATTRSLVAPTTIGGSGWKGTAYAGHLTQGRKLVNSLSIGCNAPGDRFRSDVEVHKRVRVNGRWKWVLAMRVRNQRTIQGGLERCDWQVKSAYPARVSRTTQLRTKFVTRSAGITPAAKARTTWSKPYTRAQLEGAGGSIVIR